MRSDRRPGILTALLILSVAVATPAGGQETAGDALEGDWERKESTYDPNDGMRIRVGSGNATLTYTPPTGHPSFEAGQVLWQDILASGRARVRGSDGNYYSATIKLDGHDRLHVDIDHNGPGNDQSWKRAGPSLNGDWERVTATGDGKDAMRIRVDGDEGSIRYLPRTAPKSMRVGSKIWKEIGAGGVVRVLAADGLYHAAVITLDGPDRLRVAGAGMGTETWIRPGAVAAARGAAGSGSEQDPPAGPAKACVESSLLAGEPGQAWDLGVTLGAAAASRLGLTADRSGPFEGSVAGYNNLTEFARFRAEGEEASLFIWQARGSNPETKVHWDLTSDAYHAQWEMYRDSQHRPVDIEVYPTSAGLRYAGVWIANPEGIDWWSRRDMPAGEYASTFAEKRAAGYRLIDMEAYQTPAGLRYAAIWHRGCDDAGWTQWRDMSRETYQRRLDSLSARGFRVVDFESYSTSSGQRYAAIWEKIDDDRAWRVRTDRSLPQFLSVHRRYVDEGLRLLDFEAYETTQGIRYGGVWIENDERYRMPFEQTVDDAIEAYRKLHTIAGVSVVVMRGGQVVYRRGFGWADSTAGKAAHASTIYLTASVSKAIAGTLAARLEERGIGGLDLDESAGKYVSILPDGFQPTLSQLLAKVGCVWHYDEGPEPSEGYYENAGLALAEIATSDLLEDCTPGEHYLYSTHGYTFVGAALEGAAGKPVAQIIDEEITKPFGLTSLRAMSEAFGRGDPALARESDYDLAQAYDVDSAQAVYDPIQYEENSWKLLGGGIESTALDLARFGWLILSGSIVSPGVREDRLFKSITDSAVMWDSTTQAAPRTALGWILGRPKNRSTAWHNGTAPGARSYLGLWRDDDLVVAVLTNQRDSSVDGDKHPINGLATSIADVVLTNP